MSSYTAFAHLFSSMSEDLIHCLAQHISTRSDLRHLCRVSKGCNAAFSPFLYSHIVFHDGNADILRDPEALQRFVANPRLAQVKALSFELIEGSWAIGNAHEVGRLVETPGYGRLGDMRRWAGVYNESIRQIVTHMPDLIRFDWENWPISQSLMGTLGEKCPSLRDVSIAYPNLSKFARTERTYRERGPFNEEKADMIPPPIPRFKNLRKLYLYEITGDLEEWIPQLASILTKSPLLRELGLSLSAECERQYALSEKHRILLDFFKLLVANFHAQGGRPLRLKVLKLGYGVLLNAPGEPYSNDSLHPAEYLSHLANTAALEDLYMDNDLDVGCALNLRSCCGQISWPTITSSTMSNLRRFTFTSLSQRSREWLCEHPDSAFLSSLAMGIGTERLAYSYVVNDMVHRVPAQDLQFHIGQVGDRTFFLRKYRNSPNLPLRSTTLLVLKPCQAGGLAFLGRCDWITTLAICLQKQLNAEAVRKSMVSIPLVEHLWIRIGMDYPLLNGRDEANHRGNAVRLKDGTLVEEQLYLHNFWRERWAEMAHVVANNGKTCPLEYLKIGHLAWRVLPRKKGARSCVLEPLDRWEDEVEGPKVFRYNDPVRRDRIY